MLKHIWTVVCRTSIWDKDTEEMSTIGVLDYIDLEIEERLYHFGRGIPYRFVWVTCWRREGIHKPDRGYARDVIKDPSGEIVYDQKYKISLVKYPTRYISRDIFAQEFGESGDYNFMQYVRSEESEDWITVSDIPIHVERKKKQRRSRKSKSTTDKRGKTS